MHPLTLRTGLGAAAEGEEDSGARSRWSMPPLRLRPIARRPAFPPCRPVPEALRGLAPGRGAGTRTGARRGSQVRSPLRHLPRRGRGRCRYPAHERPAWPVCPAGRSGVIQWQNARLLTESLWVRVPPPESTYLRSNPQGPDRHRGSYSSSAVPSNRPALPDAFSLRSVCISICRTRSRVTPTSAPMASSVIGWSDASP